MQASYFESHSVSHLTFKKTQLVYSPCIAEDLVVMPSTCIRVSVSDWLAICVVKWNWIGSSNQTLCRCKETMHAEQLETLQFHHLLPRVCDISSFYKVLHNIFLQSVIAVWICAACLHQCNKKLILYGYATSFQEGYGSCFHYFIFQAASVQSYGGEHNRKKSYSVHVVRYNVTDA